MIHKVKHGLMEVVLEVGTEDRIPPDLIFKGAGNREFAVFFAPFGTTEATAMLRAYDYYAPFEAVVLAHEEEDDVKEES